MIYVSGRGEGGKKEAKEEGNFPSENFFLLEKNLETINLRRNDGGRSRKIDGIVGKDDKLNAIFYKEIQAHGCVSSGISGIFKKFKRNRIEWDGTENHKWAQNFSNEQGKTNEDDDDKYNHNNDNNNINYNNNNSK